MTRTRGRNKCRMAETRAEEEVSESLETGLFLSINHNVTRRGKISHKILDMGNFPTYDAGRVGIFHTQAVYSIDFKEVIP